MKRIKIIVVAVVSIILSSYINNNYIGISNYIIESEKIPSEFSGMKILHVSDLHNKRFGVNQIKILRQIDNLNPDIIVISGDIVYRRHFDIEPVLEFLEGIKDYPVYFVTGNHEYALSISGEYQDVEKKMKELGVTVLRNEKRSIKRGSSEINILGVDDPTFFKKEEGQTEKTLLYNAIQTAKGNNPELYTMLISHRSEKLDVYSAVGLDLVFSGHAHGGQIRIPFVGGSFAPNQGALPKYTNGVYTDNNTNLIISRGLGNSIFPQRIFNTPELVLVTLQSK
jgi:predicted MPP superfamily phosphohydrolase